ncbi:DUF2127 domain-containing protein [Allobranchiibius sp. GilTou38]|uniref:DUF2127 domain-containing protein n=1 Tax=Allobranchiibius sp. GilTou38 TaxID=2815210 RepID=UPI001AA19DD0|nr:DUF2127 domain-containing protein [Allobranchiibius sp. GilTou38]
MKDKQARRAAMERRWELRSCGRHGHLTYAPDESGLASRLRADSAQGEAWRCLRCGDYALGPATASGPADDAPVPLRGKALRDAFIIRLLAIERLLRGVFLIAAAYVVWRFVGAKDSVQRVFDKDLPAVRDLSRRTGIDFADAAPTRLLQRALDAGHGTLVLLAAGVLAYGLLEMLEAYGLWIMKRWGEYVAVVGTAVFLPLEIYELTEKVSALKIAAFLINLAAVAWLIWSKHLFGVRGGRAAFEKERESTSLLEVERTAAQV